MTHSLQIAYGDKTANHRTGPRAIYPFVRFLARYPIFLLVFGPPIFRSAAVDATKGVIDIWSFLQVGMLISITSRAVYRLASAGSIAIPRRIRSILGLTFFLGLLFLASAVYSPSHLVSAAYAVLYFFTWISITEFIVDVHKDPPNWTQFLLHFRFILSILFIVVVITFFFDPTLVLISIEGSGIRLLGGAVAPLPVVCPLVAVISAYTFALRLEPRRRAAIYFFLGLVGTLITQARGAELALLFSLMILGSEWAKTGKRSAYIFISGLMAVVLFSGVVLGTVGGGRIWSIFNRGQNLEGIESASGRTYTWYFVIHYCMAHPQGMGYISGFRVLFREYFVLGLQLNVNGIGNSHNSFIDILADAGWLALAIYLVVLFKIVYLGWRFARDRVFATQESTRVPYLVIRCALVLLIFCFADGMDGADFCVPLREPFYVQNIIIAIILGISARFFVASRSSRDYWPVDRRNG